MRTDLPTGTVTFLFTDVEGSTKLLHELGAEAYADALLEHRRIIRAACAAEGGVEVDTQGDAFFFAFGSAPGAVAAASAFTETLASGPIEVRVGLHTGSPLQTAEGYVGEDVHFAARVAATSHGGQVVLSKATAELVEAELTELGEHRLKDVLEPVAIYQLGSASFPPLKTVSNTNLPRPTSSFVGREAELESVLERIGAGARLLTLTGPGGSGKTRLALEAAASLVPQYKAGVFWVGLAALRDPALVTETIAQTLGAKDGLARHIGKREMLLLLDNLEQVIEAARELSSLLQDCPNLTLLVTSRELLRVHGEVEYEVPSLQEPEAVSLFCERSKLEPSDEIAELCRRLDSLPLAVELAAARTKALSPKQILERLSQRLDLLKGGRDADPRQQTLRATTEWSYDLLSEEEQRLFRALSAFSGGSTLEAAEEVAYADLDTLQSLVEKSLLHFTNERYWMLETIREYALEQLDQSDEADAVRRRHAEHFLSVMRAANLSSGVLDLRQPMREDVAFAEQDNVRAALAWASRQRPELGLRLATAVEWFWAMHDPEEGLRWFDALFERADEAPLEVRAHALRSYATCADLAGRDELATRLYRGSLESYEQVQDEDGRANVLHRLATHAMRQGKLAEAREHADASWQLHQRNPNALARAWARARIVATFGAIARDEGEGQRAFELGREGLELMREVSNRWWESGILAELAALALEQGRPDEAASYAREALTLARAIRDRPGRIFGVGLLAVVAAEEGELEGAGRLWGAIENEDAVAPLGGWRRHRSACEARLGELADEAFERGRAAGKELALDEAVEEALGAS